MGRIPTQPQIVELRHAVAVYDNKPDGMLWNVRWRSINIRTMQIMKAEGWIREDFKIIDPIMRTEVSDTKADRIKGAHVALAADDWRMALGELKRAEMADQELNAKAWWITDEGRSVLEAATV